MPKASIPLLIYKGCLTIPYMPVVINFVLLFKAGKTPICLWAIILIMKFIAKRIIPTIKAIGVRIAIFGPLVNGKIRGGAIKVNKIKILVSVFGDLLSTLFCMERKLSTNIVIV